MAGRFVQWSSAGLAGKAWGSVFSTNGKEKREEEKRKESGPILAKERAESSDRLLSRFCLNFLAVVSGFACLSRTCFFHFWDSMNYSRTLPHFQFCLNPLQLNFGLVTKEPKKALMSFPMSSLSIHCVWKILKSIPIHLQCCHSVMR